MVPFLRSLLLLPTSMLALSLLVLGSGPLASQADAAQVRILGRLLLAPEVPAAGARLTLSASPSYAAEDEDGAGWEDLEFEADEEGRFEVLFDSPREHLIELWAQAPGHAPETWRWSRLEPGAPVDVGTLELVPAGGIEGRVLDAQGRSLLSHWQVLALPRLSPRDLPAGVPRPMMPQARFEALDFDGRFEFQGLPAGPCHLRLHLEAGGWVDGPELEVVAGKTVRADLTWEGPDLAERVHVSLATRPFHFAYPDLDYVYLLTGDGDRLRPRVNLELQRGLDFDGLAPGTYTLVVDDPLFEPLRLEGLRPGSGAINATLRGAAAVRFLVESGDGRWLDEYDVRLIVPRHAFPPHGDPWRDRETLSRPMGRSATQLLPQTDATTGRGAFDGLLPGAWTFIVRSEPLAPCFVTVELEPDEIRTVEVKLTAGGVVQGNLTSSGGAVPRGSTVSLFVPGEEELAPLDRFYPDRHFPDEMRGRGFERSQTRTEADGRFTLPAVAPGTYHLVARTLDRRVGVTTVEVLEGGRPSVTLAVEHLPVPGR